MAHSTPPLQAQTERVLDAFERATGLSVCVRVLGGQWHDELGRGILGPRHKLHTTPFCLAVKARHVERCTRNDHRELPQLCPAGREPFVRTCHAGADEVLIPLHDQDRLLGVIFVGQFRRRGTQPQTLPRRTTDEWRSVLARALPLRAYFLDVLARLAERRRRHADGPAARIEAFVRQRLAADPALGDLARHLALSPSRAGHLVAEVMGEGWRATKDSVRLEVARQLLARSDAKIAWVAAQAGFADAAYFSRFFSRRIGMSPLAFRRKFGIPPGV
mgnify:CR=1 FL=1